MTLIHGWGMNGQVFTPIYAALADYYEVKRLVLPGHGGYEWLVGKPIDDQVQELSREVDRGILLGWSLGGLYALEMVRQFPGKFSSLVLVCCNPCFVQKKGWDAAVENKVFDQFTRDLDKGWASTIQRFLTLQMHGVENSREMVRSFMAILRNGAEPTPQGLENGLHLLKTCDYRDQLRDIDIPVTFILGERDPLVPIQVANEIYNLNRSIRVELLHGAGHAPFLSHNQAFLELILN
ncbi:MAG: pimeloyl-[acyl-carrier protein] methyl ester esterase [Gammaproteobacteria bacterium]|jgi:pimeloyl-[acyl-carrier protein] methyl ester esterase